MQDTIAFGLFHGAGLAGTDIVDVYLNAFFMGCGSPCEPIVRSGRSATSSATTDGSAGRSRVIAGAYSEGYIYALERAAATLRLSPRYRRISRPIKADKHFRFTSSVDLVRPKVARLLA